MGSLYHFQSGKASFWYAAEWALCGRPFTICHLSLTIHPPFAGLLKALPVPTKRHPAKEPIHEQIKIQTLSQSES